MEWSVNRSDWAEDYVPGHSTDPSPFSQTLPALGLRVTPESDTMLSFPSNSFALYSSSLGPIGGAYCLSSNHNTTLGAGASVMSTSVAQPSRRASPVAVDGPSHLDPTATFSTVPVPFSDDSRAASDQISVEAPSVCSQPAVHASSSFSSALEERRASFHSDVIGQEQEIRQNSQILHSYEASPPRFQCRWEGCRYSGYFHREAELMRHIKTLHVSPRAHHCPVGNCSEVFNRKDNLKEHKKRCHRLG